MVALQFFLCGLVHAAPQLDDFFGYYDACLAGLVDREARAAVLKEERIQAAHKKAWG